MKKKSFILLTCLISLFMCGCEEEQCSSPPIIIIHGWNNSEILEANKNISPVDKALLEMKFGELAFNAPETININDSHQIQLLLSLSETADQIRQKITEAGKKVNASIKVSDRMEAHLSGNSFHIKPIRPEVQAVSEVETTEWNWEIQPKERGTHVLHLTLTALLEINGHDTPRSLKTFDHIIDVEVTTTQWFVSFFNKNWQWIWAAILVPVVGWIWKKKHANQNMEPAEETPVE